MNLSKKTLASFILAEGWQSVLSFIEIRMEL